MNRNWEGRLLQAEGLTEEGRLGNGSQMADAQNTENRPRRTMPCLQSSAQAAFTTGVREVI